MSQLIKISEVIRAAESAAKAAEAAKSVESAVNAAKAAGATVQIAKASADVFSAASTDDPNAPQSASPLDFRSFASLGLS